MSVFFDLFEEIDSAVFARFGSLMLPLKIIGRAALEIAGLPDRGTKDVDDSGVAPTSRGCLRF